MVIYHISVYLFAGEPFDAITALDEQPQAKRIYAVMLGILALFVFSCCALNVFIAVLCDIYDQEQDRLVCTHLQERARICMILFLRPNIAYGHITQSNRRFIAAWVAITVSAIGVCIVLIMLMKASMDGRLTMWAPAFVIAFSVIMIQGILRAVLTKDWKDLHLWFCHEAILDERDFLTSGDKHADQVG
jgi:hypothetical protein